MAQQDPAAFNPVPAPPGGLVPLARLAPLAVFNPVPSLACSVLITDTGARLVTDTGLAFCVGLPGPPPPPPPPLLSRFPHAVRHQDQRPPHHPLHRRG